jgi:hypothetical protein
MTSTNRGSSSIEGAGCCCFRYTNGELPLSPRLLRSLHHSDDQSFSFARMVLLARLDDLESAVIELQRLKTKKPRRILAFPLCMAKTFMFFLF